MLFECLVAGTSHRPNLEKYEPKLKLGQALHLSREPDSHYDDWAVQVHTGLNEPPAQFEQLRFAPKPPAFGRGIGVAGAAPTLGALRPWCRVA